MRRLFATHRSNRGIGVLIIPIVMVTLLLGSAAMIQVTTSFKARTKAEAIRRHDAYYTTEIVLWHNYTKFMAEPTATGTEVARLPASYPTEVPPEQPSYPYYPTPSGVPPQSDGKIGFPPPPPNLSTTRNLDTAARSLFARFEGENITFTRPDLLAGKKSICSDITITKKRYRQCLIAEWDNPTVSLSALPASVAVGESAMLTWSSSIMSQCSLTPPGNTELSKTNQPTGPLTTNTTYRLTCQGPRGPLSVKKTVTVAGPLSPPPPPPCELKDKYKYLASGGSLATKDAACKKLGAGWALAKLDPPDEIFEVRNFLTSYATPLPGDPIFALPVVANLCKDVKTWKHPNIDFGVDCNDGAAYLMLVWPGVRDKCDAGCKSTPCGLCDTKDTNKWPALCEKNCGGP